MIAFRLYETVFTRLLLLFAVAFNLYELYPEVAIRVPMLNDGVLHLLALQRTVAALAAGRDPTDPWLPTIDLGYPLFHYYQHLPYVLPALVYLPLRGIIPLADFFHWLTYLLLSLFPLSIYWSMRRFGFARLAAAFGGLLAPLLATNGLYGLDLESYVWGGYGLYTQLWGMLLLPLALAQCYAALRTGRGYFWAVLLLAATVLSHVVLGYIALASVVLFALLPALGRLSKAIAVSEVWRRGKRLALLLALVALAASYFLVPFFLDGAYLNRSVWELAGKYDSYGYQWVLGTLAGGGLFDYGRFPTLTILAGAGLVVCLWRWRRERYRVPVVLAIVWLLLYFGRPTWGVLLNLLPMSHDLQLHRLIAGVHLGGIYLMGIGLALPWRWAASRRSPRYLLAAAGLTVLLLYPVYQERASYLAQNTRWMTESQGAYFAQEKDVSSLVAWLRHAPPGRVYAGLAAKWGKNFRVGAVPVSALLQSAGFDMVGYLYHALSLNADVEILFDERRPEQYNLFNVRYVVAPKDHAFPAFVRRVKDFGRFRLYEVATTGYFDLVGSYLTLVGGKGDFFPAASRWLASDEPRVKQHPSVLFGGAPAAHRPVFPLAQAGALISETVLTAEPPRGRVVAETVESDAYRATIQVTRASTLVLKETYHPDWHATVDGRAARTEMVMPSYVGVQVGPGTHRVLLEYRPSPLRGLLMIVGLLTLALMALMEWQRDRLTRRGWRLSLANAPSGPRPGAPVVPSWGRVLPTRPRALPFTVALPATVAARLRAMRAALASETRFLAVVAAAVLAAGLPLLQLQEMSGHDTLEYLPRNVEFFRALADGQLLPRWAPDLDGGYGQPLFLFNPPLIYYTTALFHALGASFVGAEDLAILALLAAGVLGMYVLARGPLGRWGAVAAAAGYAFAEPVLVTLYVRHALADFAACAILPWAVWGVLYATTGRGRWWLVPGAVATALLLLASNPVALLAAPFLGTAVLWAAARARRRVALGRGLASLAFGCGLSAFFWLPALAERREVHLARLLADWLRYTNHFVWPHQLVVSPWGYGISVPGPHDGMSFALGPVHLAALVLGVAVLARRVRPSLPLVGPAVILVVLAAYLSTGLAKWLWDALPLLQYLEYPWRALVLCALGTALLCGLPVLLVERRFPRLAGVACGVMLALLLLAELPHAHPATMLAVDQAAYTPAAIDANVVMVTTRDEYEPAAITQTPPRPARGPAEVVAGYAAIRELSRDSVSVHLAVQALKPTRLRLHTAFFPGWRLRVDGQERPILHDNPQGLMQVNLTPGNHDLWLRFGDTPVRTAAELVSALAALLLAVGWPRRRWFRRSPPQPASRSSTISGPSTTPRRSSSRLLSIPGHLAVGLRSRRAVRAALTPAHGYAGDPSTKPARVGLRTRCGIYLLFLSIYLPSAAGHFFTTDPIATYMTAQSLVERHSLAIQPIYNTTRGRDGRYYGAFGLGQSIAVIPLYLAGKLVDGISPPAVKRYFGGVYLPGDGGTVLYGGTVPIFFVSLLNQFVTPLICVLVFLFCVRLGFSVMTSFITTLIFGLSTAAWVYARDSFQHPLESLLLLLCVYILFSHKANLRPRHALLAGMALAFGILTRINFLLVVPAIAIYLFYIAQNVRSSADRITGGVGSERQHSQVRTHRVLGIVAPNVSGLSFQGISPIASRYLLVFLAPGVLVLGVIMSLNYLKFGTVWTFEATAQAKGFSTPLWVGLYGNLFSLGRSIFLYSPPTLLALYAFRPFYRAHRAEALLFLSIPALYLLIYSNYGYWDGGWAWGPRFLVATIPFLIIPVGYFFGSRRRMAIVALLACLGIGVQILGVALNYGFVFEDWINMRLRPENAFLFVPDISPIPTHLRDLLQGRYIDVWLLEVYQQFGLSVFLATLAVPLLVLAGALALLGYRRHARPHHPLEYRHVYPG